MDTIWHSLHLKLQYSPCVTASYPLSIETGNLQYNGPICISFAYHMFGVNMGRLEVRVGTRNVWQMSGNQGNTWREAQVATTLLSGEGVRIQRDEVLLNVQASIQDLCPESEH